MRHKVKGRKLGRTASHRKATLRALAVALIQERRIKTTTPKAKELRRFVEPLITRAKTDTTHNRRMVFSRLQDKYAVTELFEEVGPAAADRPGGYTRVLKLGFRQGDTAEVAVIELVDFNDVPPEKRTGKKKRTRRAGKSSGSSESVTPKKAEKQPDSDTKDGEEAAASVDEKSTDFNVDEVKSKLESMSPQEAREFTDGDERVTVQRAVEKLSEEG